MQEHAELGDRLLAHVPLLNQEGARVIRSHHERWDGNGYPDRLSEESIPLAARIFAVVDSLDAMTDKRPYRAPVSWEAAAEEIRRCRGSHFDPDVVDGFEACEPELYRLHMAELAPPDGRGEGGRHDRPPLASAQLTSGAWRTTSGAPSRAERWTPAFAAACRSPLPLTRVPQVASPPVMNSAPVSCVGSVTSSAVVRKSPQRRPACVVVVALGLSRTAVTELIDRHRDLAQSSINVTSSTASCLSALIVLPCAVTFFCSARNCFSVGALRLLTRRRGGYVHGRGNRRDPDEHQETLHRPSLWPPATCGELP